MLHALALTKLDENYFDQVRRDPRSHVLRQRAQQFKLQRADVISEGKSNEKSAI